MSTDSPAWADVRGKLLKDAPLAPYTWFRVGGAADALFLPADQDDLCAFLKALPEEVPVTVLGVGSNTIVRDGGIEGVVIRLMGGYWGASCDRWETGSAPAPARLISTSPNRPRKLVCGGSVFSIRNSRLNRRRGAHQCRLLWPRAERCCDVGRRGHQPSWGAGPSGDRKDIGFSYRHTDFATSIVVTQLHLKGAPGGDPETLAEEIAAHQKRRAETQPIKDKTGGSTFANPDPPGTPEARSSWKLIDAAGCRGLRVGGAMVSEKHCNFLINTGEATAADIEALGELGPGSRFTAFRR